MSTSGRAVDEFLQVQIVDHCGGGLMCLHVIMV